MNLLNEREKTHGKFEDVAHVAQEFKTTIWAMQETNGLPWVLKEALEMMCTKIARIVSGDCYERDHWVDLIGYSQLALTYIDKEKKDAAFGEFIHSGTHDEPTDASIGDDWDYDPNYRPRSGVSR